MSSSHKKAIVRTRSYEALPGYMSQAGLAEMDSLEMLDLSGKVLTLALAEVKWVCFVRDFNSGEIDNPERLLKKTFASRPRGAGVWLRLKLSDGDAIEGMAANDITMIAGSGIFLTPPDVRSNTQRMFIPRTAIAELEVVAVIAPIGKRKTPVDAPAAEKGEIQESLFS